jgi:hypothetical protein
MNFVPNFMFTLYIGFSFNQTCDDTKMSHLNGVLQGKFLIDVFIVNVTKYSTISVSAL